MPMAVIKRILYLHLLPDQLIQKLANYGQLKVITPTPQAARALRVPHQSLETLAQQILLKKGVRIAPALIAHRALRTAASEVIPAIKAVLRAGIDPDALTAIGSARTRQLSASVRAYQIKLQATGFIDAAQVLWEATHLLPEQQSLLIYGYVHPRVDELAFLDAAAGDGSVMILPCPNSAIFAENQEAIEWLQQQGWQIEEFDEAPKTLGEQLQASFLKGTVVPLGVQAHVYPQQEAERGAWGVNPGQMSAEAGSCTQRYRLGCQG